MSSVNDFLDQRTLAVVGVSRSEKKFSRRLYRTLKKRGYNVFAVNPNMDSIDGEICYENLQSLPQKADGAVIVVPPDQTNRYCQ
ncbi:CoA-binding protein [Dehalobacter sp. TBBPA1]|uniref:CoA-binding protein n=1 Tax=Dehalobacter sp. TBBPA1 TaxID=3235037 RepID=UPI0034A278F2